MADTKAQEVPAATEESQSGMMKRRAVSQSRSRSPHRRSSSRARSGSRGRRGDRGRRRRHRRRRRSGSGSRSRSGSPRRRRRRRSGSRSPSRRRRGSRSPPRRRRGSRSPPRRRRRGRRGSHSRSRSSSGGRRRGGRRYGRGRSRSRSPPFRRGGRRGRDDFRGRGVDRTERSPSSESAKAEAHTRDARTIFVSQLVRRATEKQIKKYFEVVGKVRNVQLIRDRSGASKGIAYVEFKALESVPAACLLNGRQFCMKHPACTCSGFPILVKDSEAHKNHMYRAQKMAEASATATGGVPMVRTPAAVVPHPMMHMVHSMNPTNPLNPAAKLDPAAAASQAVSFAVAGAAAAAAGMQASGVPAMNRVHVSNLANGVTDTELRAIFSVFGAIESVSMHQGYAFVHYVDEAGALKALRSAGEVELRGLTLKVNTVFDQSASRSSIDLDDSVNGGVALNSAQRVALMQRLAGRDGSGAGAGPAAVAVAGAVVPAGAGGAGAGAGGGPAGLPPLKPVVGDPARSFMVRNMFDPTEETEENWDRDIQDDVAEESRKYGSLVHIFLDKNSAGHVYMMFKTVEEGQRAVKDLHGRFFARRRLTCDFIPTDKYLQKFPDADKASA